MDFSVLAGKTLISIEGGVGSESIIFTTVEGEKFEMSHGQDCCESVEIESIEGDFDDLLNTPIIIADEAVSENEVPDGFEEPGCDSYTWTFYRLATIKGWVVIRWFGQSNGYYSESVSFYQTKVV